MKNKCPLRRRVLIVDDEPPARRRLKRLLGAHPEVEVVGEAEDADEAAGAIDTLRPDLVFLDIRMPAGSGFDALARAEHRPLVVFVTAYDEYALRAFEADSLDYLLKPVTDDKLARCLEKMARLAPREPSPFPSLQDAMEK
ncbi:MAG: LytR/AlgR family response regulator transcription factor, partial [Acidobacteriota bacterium]